MKRLAPFLLLAAYLCGTLPLCAQVTFEIKNAGLTVLGSFEGHTMDIAYDPSQPEQASFQGTIDVSTIDTGIELRDKHLKDEDYFDVAQHPTMTYASNQVTPLANGHLDVAGTLTIKGESRGIRFEVVPEETADGWRFSTEIQLDRLDYGVGQSSWILADEVTCFIQGTLN